MLHFIGGKGNPKRNKKHKISIIVVPCLVLSSLSLLGSWRDQKLPSIDKILNEVLQLETFISGMAIASMILAVGVWVPLRGPLFRCWIFSWTNRFNQTPIIKTIESDIIGHSNRGECSSWLLLSIAHTLLTFSLLDGLIWKKKDCRSFSLSSHYSY